MRDWELYATILGVQAPGRVERVELDVAGGAVHVWLARTEGAPAPCPECQTACPIYDHREREWRHLDTCQLQTRLHARVPRASARPTAWCRPRSRGRSGRSKTDRRHPGRRARSGPPLRPLTSGTRGPRSEV